MYAARRKGSGVRRYDYDVLIVGSGFGGSVAALRLTEKGYRVGVLEAGRRFGPDDLPRTSWDLRNFLWAPRLGLLGIQRMSLLRNVVVLSGAGVGGGSLVYANTLYEPLDPFYADPQWSGITDWRQELAPYYDQARRMLGVTRTPFETEPDRVMREVACDLGVGDSYHASEVGVWFGEPGETVPDPYFGGAGPPRSGCIRCGACMTGCRHGAKNSLDANYLYLAERNGAVIHPTHLAVEVQPLEQGGYVVTTRHPSSRSRAPRRRLRAEQVILSASALGTQRLLHAMRDRGLLSRLSSRLGHLTRTNSEAILTVVSRRVAEDLSQGIAIGSSFHADAETHIEPVRYGRGSNSMALLSTILVEGGGRMPRWVRFLGGVARHPVEFARALSVRRWSERAIIVLAMQARDNSLRVFRKRGPWGSYLWSEQGHGLPNPNWIPIAHEVAHRVARRIDGRARSTLNDALLDIPTTAHLIGGCTIGPTPDQGVIDPYQRAHGHPGLHVADGSAISANLGVNPALTITAMTERAVALWPNRGERDPRPVPGEPYRRLPPVPPRRPAVPASAPAALFYGGR